MKRHILRAALAVLLLAGPLQAQTPPLINYQGRVAVGGVNFAGPNGRFKFALVNAAGTTTYWSQDGSSVGGSQPTNFVTLPVSSGLYSVLLGDTTLAGMAAIPATVFANPDLRLRVWFSDLTPTGFQLLSPDQRLAPAAYLADGSVMAGTIADQAVTGAKIADDAITAAKVADGAITAEAISTNQINVSHLVVQPTTPGQVLGYNGTDIAWLAPAGGGVWSQSGTNAYYNGGKVGIGTMTPAGALQLANGGLAITGSSSPFTGAGQGLFLERNGAAGGVFAFNYTNFTPMPLLLNSPGGSVGIGTSTPDPAYRLSVLGSTLMNVASLKRIEFGTPNTEAGLSVIAPVTSLNLNRADVRFDGTTLKLLAGLGTGAMPSTNGIAVNTAGNVGIGTATPAEKLDVRGTIYADGLGLRANPGATNQVTVLCDNPGVSFFVPYNRATNRALSLIVDEASVRTLTIRGGADLAEPFQMKEEALKKGSVVVIDDKHPGQLKQSTGAYDTRVAGIISGANGVNPGIALHQEGVMEGGQNVALSGRVYAQAEASTGPIKPGDLLTTSDLPGHAMKVRDHTRAQGAVIGKAMSALEEGTGMVLVLVTLQ